MVHCTRVNSIVPALLTYSGLNKAHRNAKQDMQRTYNLTLRRLRATTVAVEKQSVLTFKNRASYI